MLNNIEFKRKFSYNFFKSERLHLAKMKFGNLPLKTERGDIYPSIYEKGSFTEECRASRYVFTPDGSAASARLIGSFNPYSTYDVAPEQVCDGAKIGFCIKWDKMLKVYAKIDENEAEFICDFEGKETSMGRASYKDGMHFLFTFHAGTKIEVYTDYNDNIALAGKIEIPECAELIYEKVFSSAVAALYIEACGEVVIRSVDNYLDSGIMQADPKPVKYENGEVMIEDGKIYITYSSRYDSCTIQQIASYKLSTCELKLEGALLFDSGDGKWCDDVASSLIYDRNEKIWRVWLCVFSHGHVLAYGQTKNDPRFGINVMDVTPLPLVDNEFSFGGIWGDEDPDLYYNSEDGYWYLTICRNDPETKKYRYYLFRSKRPERDFEFVSHTKESLETTGGSFVKFNDKIYFAFGRSFSETAKYDICAFPSLEKLGEIKCNHNDGGFRGWGTLFEIPCGSRKRLLWITFDRTCGSDYNWSYGNVYVFESETFKA